MQAKSIFYFSCKSVCSRIQKDDTGEICSFKLHALMHDVALEVSRKEICPPTSSTRVLDEAIRHISLNNKHYADSKFAELKYLKFRFKARIRTYLHVLTYSSIIVDTQRVFHDLKHFKRLRTLDLSYLGIETFPDSIGEFIHLRYLDLSYNAMEVLPNSIRNLYNLQTLVMNGCKRLKELPKNFSKLVNLQTLGLNAYVELKEFLKKFSDLVNLRVLGLHYCKGLVCMPLEMSKLTKLYKLSMFVVGVAHSSLNQHAELESLKALKKLRGDITIVIPFPISDVFAKDNTIREGGYIRDKEHLYNISFECKHADGNEGATDYEEELLGALQPHENLKKLTILDYQGVRMSRWAIRDNLTSSLPNLVRLQLSGCCELEGLLSLGKLQYLKHLTLENLWKLEYMEIPPETISVHGSQFFPCLEELNFFGLPKLKEWWGRSEESMEGDSNSIFGSSQPHQSSLVFLLLINLNISGCPNLTSLPRCSNVETLHLSNFNEGLRIASHPTSCLELREVAIDSMSWLYISLHVESFQSLTKLEVLMDNEVESLGDFGRVFQACSSSLRTLHIRNCSKLRSVSGGLGYLTALERLTLSDLPIVDLEHEEIKGNVECDGMPWGALCHTLQYLDIVCCKELKTLPKWMRKLTSLQRLQVYSCSKELYERCQNPYGEDWPFIQHIPSIKFVQ